MKNFSCQKYHLSQILIFSAAVILSCALILPSFKLRSFALTLPTPLKDHPIGSYFTKNGKSCTCHGKGNCIPSGSDCNCLRYYKYKGKTYDLLGVQCIGFARMCQLRLFGYFDYGSDKDKFINLAGKKLYANEYSLSEIKKYIVKSPMGTHMRIGGHSIIILSADEKGFTTYECNGKTKGSECKIFSRTFTYEEFYRQYSSSTLHYLNFPKEISKNDSTTPLHTTKAPIVTTTVAIVTTSTPSVTSIPAQIPSVPTLSREDQIILVRLERKRLGRCIPFIAN